jgi:hypothetical protein
MVTLIKKDGVCNTCTLKLVSIAYKRQPLFRLLREPLKLGMRLLAWVYQVDPNEFTVRTPACYDCVRFYKLALKEKSGLFRWLNDRVNPIFDAWLDQIVTDDEMRQAKTYARSASAGEVTNETAEAWMKGQKTGF